MSITVIRDLRHLFGPARDQGARPTCLAFACSDMHAAARGPWCELSPEYLYFHAVRREGVGPHDGACLPYVLAALAEDGQPEEEHWPYLAAIPSDLTLWQPPPVSVTYRRRAEAPVAVVDEIIRRLDEGRPTLVAMTITKGFMTPREDGVVDTTEPVLEAMRHAVIAVGHGADGPNRLVLVRNSWGETWGDHGYAWVAERYLSSRVRKMVIMREAA